MLQSKIPKSSAFLWGLEWGGGVMVKVGGGYLVKTKSLPHDHDATKLFQLGNWHGDSYGSGEGPLCVVENWNLVSHLDDLRMEAYVIRMT